MHWSRWALLASLGITALGHAEEPDKRVLRDRYDELKQRYEVLKRRGVDLRATDARVQAIERARQHNDLRGLAAALAELDSAFQTLEQPKPSESDTGAPSDGTQPPLAPSPLITSPGKAQRAVIGTLASNPAFRQLLAYKGNPRRIDSSGAAGRNIDEFSDVAAQRDAGWVLALALVETNPEYFEKAARAVEFAFGKQDPSGYFHNGQGASPRTAINADTFFLQAYGQMLWILKEDNSDPAYTARIEALLPKVRQAMAWLRQNTDEMLRQDGHTANRLVFDALAFQLNGKLLGDPGLVAIGNGFLRDVVAAQRSDGVFIEKGGHDSSYQAVTLMNLQIAWSYADDARLRQQLFDAVRLGMAWLKPRILPSGEVSAEGNTRTGLGQESFFGKVKEINYGEVAYCLYYWSVIADDAEAGRLADSVMAFALKHG